MAFGSWLKKIEQDNKHPPVVHGGPAPYVPPERTQLLNNVGENIESVRGATRRLPDGQEQHYKGLIRK